MSASPLVTIAIPTWNRYKSLSELVLSVCSQADQYGVSNDVETLISDDTSSDETSNVISALQQQTSVRIRYQRNEINLGTVQNIRVYAQLD
jgi:glycosyltransferase involved in cell wall biosynthesis